MLLHEALLAEDNLVAALVAQQFCQRAAALRAGCVLMQLDDVLAPVHERVEPLELLLLGLAWTL